jgi:hypothetical protein
MLILDRGVTMSVSARILIARASAVARHTARHRRKQLERELAGYASESDLRDSEAMLDCCLDGSSQELRNILAAQSDARRQQRWPGMHGSPR